MSAFRKSYEVVGYAVGGALYCTDCCDPSAYDADEQPTPCFLGDVESTAFCDSCIGKWIRTRTDDEAKKRAPSWVFLDGEGPTDEAN